MADDEQLPTTPAGLSNRPIWILIVLNFLAVCGIGAFVAMQSAHKGGKAKAEDTQKAHEKKHAQGPLLPLDAVVTNVGDAKDGRYIKVTISIEAENEEKKKKIEERIPVIRNRMLVYFAGLKLDHVFGAEHMKRAADDLRKEINDALGANLALNVFFTDFVVQ